MTAINRPGTPMSFFGGAMNTSETSIRLIPVPPILFPLFPQLIVFQVEGNRPAGHFEFMVNDIVKSPKKNQIEFNVDSFTNILVKSNSAEAYDVEFNFDLLNQLSLSFPPFNSLRVRVDSQWTYVVPTSLMANVEVQTSEVEITTFVPDDDIPKTMKLHHDTIASWLEKLKLDAFDESSVGWKAIIQTAMSALTLHHAGWRWPQRRYHTFHAVDAWKDEWKITMKGLIATLTDEVNSPSGFVVDFCRMIHYLLESQKTTKLWIEIYGHMCWTMAFSTSSEERKGWIEKTRRSYQVCYEEEGRVAEFLELIKMEDGADQLFDARCIAAKALAQKTVEAIRTDLIGRA